MKTCQFFLILILITITGCKNKLNVEQLTIDNFIKAIKSNGMVVGEKKEKIYQLLMAVDGCAFDVDGDSIEIYQFDTTIESGKQMIKRLATKGYMGHTVITNKNLMIFADKKHKDWDRIVKVFNGL